MNKLKPQRIDLILLALCFIMTIGFLVSGLNNAHELMLNPSTRMTHDNSFAFKVKDMIESGGWLLTICKLFVCYFLGLCAFILFPLSIAARWLRDYRQQLNPKTKWMLLMLLVLISIIICYIDLFYFYLLLWFIDIIYVIVKTIYYFCKK